MGPLGFLLPSQNSDTGVKKASFLTKAFQEHFLSLPPFSLLTHSREEPRTSSPPVHMLGLALHVGQSESERHIYLGSGVFFFSWKHKIYTMINKKSIRMSSQAYCLKRCSPWILLHISSFQLISQGIFTENVILSHNTVGNVFSPLTSGSLLPFSPCSCSLRRVWPEEEGLDNYFSEEPWKAQCASAKGIIQCFSPLFSPL